MKPTSPRLFTATTLLILVPFVVPMACDDATPSATTRDTTVQDAHAGDGTHDGTDADAAPPPDVPGDDLTTASDGVTPQDVYTVDDATNLQSAVGCEGVFNPDQVLVYHLEMEPTAWQAVLSDATYTSYQPAYLRCADGPAILVAVRRKRSGGVHKVGLKVDINRLVPGQTFFGLAKLSLENGVSEGGTEEASAGALVAEYLAWRLFDRSGAISGRAAFVELVVNGELVGVYVNLEQVDKRYLASHLGDDTGWLYKKSGGIDDGYKTREAEANPLAARFCFWEKNGCPMPSQAELATLLPQILDIRQMLLLGAVNALIANRDSPLLKDNNYYFYDYEAGPRVYLPWDLDTAMTSNYDVFTGTSPGGTTMYVDALFSHWEDDYDAVLTELLAGPSSLTAVLDELERVDRVAAPALDRDPALGAGATRGATDRLRAWWSVRIPEVQAQVDAH